jgi:hypothetical protein
VTFGFAFLAKWLYYFGRRISPGAGRHERSQSKEIRSGPVQRIPARLLLPDVRVPSLVFLLTGERP